MCLEHLLDTFFVAVLAEFVDGLLLIGRRSLAIVQQQSTDAGTRFAGFLHHETSDERKLTRRGRPLIRT